MTNAGLLPQLERVPTGIPGLDRILEGGLLRGGSYLIVGTPGAGKTILSNQLCFEHVKQGGRAVYVTVLAESHTRLLAHLRSFSFFDPTPISDTLQYFSGYSMIEKAGLDGMLDWLRREVRTQKATLLVIDGLNTVGTIADSTLTFKRFLNDMQASLDLLGCTTVLQTQPSTETRFGSVFTLVDGVITLLDRLHGVQAVREVEVQKFRGSNYLRGRHQFQITNDGLIVHPRTETVLAVPPDMPLIKRERLVFNLASFDQMLGGGLLAGSSTLLLGPPGSGKTLLGLHFLAAGAAVQQPGLYLGFYELPAQLIDTANQVGLDFDAAVGQGLIEVFWQSPDNPLLDVIAERLIESIERRGVRRVFIDGLGGFQRAATHPERLSGFLLTLTAKLRSMGVTTLVSVSMPDLFTPVVVLPIQSSGEIVDNIVFVRYVELRSQLYRLISLIKVRETSYDPTIREFKITDRGIDVANTFESAETILTDVNRTKPASSPDNPAR